eukprot:evm.model.NODE_41503_length_12158_cov_22.054943.1
MTGKVGADVTLEQGQQAARIIAINLLATLKGALGDLDKVDTSPLPSVPLFLRPSFSILFPHSYPILPLSFPRSLISPSQIKRIVKLVGFVNCVDGYSQQPTVVNGASDFFVQVLGERGVHARSAVGTNALPLNIPVEIEAIVEVEE